MDQTNPTSKGWNRLTTAKHAARIGALMVLAAALLGWLASRTEVMYADGLRYVAGAQAVERGDWSASIVRAVDHPAYPMAIAGAHRLLGGGESPQDWQTAAQVASVVAGVLLIIPLYLVALELHGATAAWLACALPLLIPNTGHVLADVLSEGLFLLFWTWGCWFTLRFLKRGETLWLAPMVLAAGLAYLTRPEGLLLPAALAATLGLMLPRPSIRLSWPAWIRATALIVIGPLLVMGPYVALKGGIGTKPAVARLLGTAPKSATMAVERERPLDPDQTAIASLAVACRAVVRALQGSVTTPLLVLAIVGFFLRPTEPDPSRARGRLFVGIVCAAWILALVRLYETGGYCTPRHALIAALPLIAAAARGLVGLSKALASRFAGDGAELHRGLIQATAQAACLLAIGGFWGKQTLAPINGAQNGYRKAGEWLAERASADATVFDLKGWALYYGGLPGYSFADYGEALGDPKLDWLVAHDAFLVGEWDYCQTVRDLTAGRAPVKSFPEIRRKGVSRVHVFKLSPDLARSDPSPDSLRK